MYSRGAVPAELERRTRGYFIIFLWIFIAVLYFSFVRQWVTVKANDKLFADYFSHVIQVAASEQRPTREIRALILTKAQDLSLPIRGDEISITGSGQTLRAAVHYNADISMPIVNHSVYRMRFDHDLAYGPPR
jgi:hypothetical protein